MKHMTPPFFFSNVIELRFILNLITTGGDVQTAFPKSQTSLCKKPYPAGPISHFAIIWTLSLKTDVTFQKSFSQGPHSFLKYQSLRL